MILSIVYFILIALKKYIRIIRDTLMFLAEYSRSKLNRIKSPSHLQKRAIVCGKNVHEFHTHAHRAPALGEFRRLSTRLVDGMRSFDLPRPRTRDVKATCAPQRLRRRWYIRKHWAHRFVPEVFFAAENFLRHGERRARSGRYQGCTRSTRTLNYRSLSSRRKFVYKIVEYDEIVSPCELLEPTREHRRKTINIFALVRQVKYQPCTRISTRKYR